MDMLLDGTAAASFTNMVSHPLPPHLLPHPHPPPPTTPSHHPWTGQNGRHFTDDYKVWDQITYPYLKLNAATVEV